MSFEMYATYREIKLQPEAWAQALDVTFVSNLPKVEDYDQAVFTGCGSTYYLSPGPAALFQELTGRAARVVPSEELLFNSQAYLTNKRTLQVAISHSGTSTEAVKAVEKFKAEKCGEGGVPTFIIP